MAYLTDLRRVYELQKIVVGKTYEASEEVTEEEKIPEKELGSSRYAFNVEGNDFSVGMIDLPDDFSVDKYDKTYKKIYKAGYRPPCCRSAPMSILGSTVFNTLTKHRTEGVFVPRLNRFSREGTKGQGMLQLPSLTLVAQSAEQEVVKHLSNNDRETLSKALLFKLLAPDRFRVCGTFFNAVALVGDLSDNHNHRHRDKEDLCSIIVTLGKGISAGSTLYWGGSKEDDIVLHREEFCHGKFQVGPFDRVHHSGEFWTGPRGVLAFYLNKKMYQHFLEHGNKFTQKKL